ncbi:phage tail spike protein [Paenibacillus polymyxa]|uniref:phage tail spike protein n=1 Tax=Paenibacillus polymyxa TaxID=1406 RepID=UPI002AB4BEDA|nr:phage tail spike protein [Paenibacillus polymyxa]MDY8023376.1 phage tail spike protein [Paenibacillus polymyxa]
MIGNIDYSLKPIQPQYFLCKPDREIISKISEAYNDSRVIKINETSTMELTIPFSIDINHRLMKNKNADILRERYLIKVVEDYKVEWYIIKEITDASDENSDAKTVKCGSLTFELGDKSIRGYEVVSYHAKQVMNDLLANTLWNIGYIDPDFQLTNRSFSFDGQSVLDAIYSVAETYNAIVRFDTDKRTIDLIKPELFGNNLGLTLSYSKYVKTMNITSDTNNMVTRLKAFGQDDMGIQNVNPTGQNYIEDFSYFIYPFKRDVNKNVIQSSYYMSDSLCHALLDYAELLKSKKGLYDSYLKERQGYEKQLNQLNVELDSLLKDQSILTEIQLSQQFDNQMYFEKYQHSGNTSKSFSLTKKFGYAVMAKVENANNITVRLDGSQKNVLSNQWSVLGKIKDADSTNVSFSGGNSSVIVQVAYISQDEYNATDNNTALISKYNYDNMDNRIRIKREEILSVENQIKNVKSRINDLQDVTSYSKNFTNENLTELNGYVIEREFSDSKYIDEQDLYDATLNKFRELQVPQLTLDIDIVNFLEIVEAQYDWKKLNLGDFVNIKYEPTGVNVTARITEISYNYESSEINLTVSNVKKVNNNDKELENFLANANKTSVIVDSKKNKWGGAVYSSNNMTKLFEKIWNSITNEVNMASNEFVTVDSKGITIYDPHDPLNIIRLTHGVIGLSMDGGLSYRTALTPERIVAEEVMGKLIVGERLTLGDIESLLEITGAKFSIYDRCERLVQRIGLLSTNPDVFGMTINRFEEPNVCGNDKILNKLTVDNVDGFKLERNRNGTFEKTLYTSPDGDLFVKGNFQAGEGENVLRIDKDGFAVGASEWHRAPFRANYQGQVWMVGADISDSVVVDSKFQVGSGNRIVVIDQNGLRLGSADENTANAVIRMDGSARFKNIEITKPDGTKLMNSLNGDLHLNNFSIIGAGMVDAQLMAANIFAGDSGVISDLTAGRLSTLTNAAITDWSNYITIEGNKARWITGKVTQGEQKKLPDGRLLYWETSAQSGKYTINETPWPVYVYDTSQNQKIKMEDGFEGSGDASTPYRKMGLGDGATETSGVGWIKKPNGSFDFIYGASNTGKERSLKLGDEGVFITSQDKDVIIRAKDINLFSSAGGATKLGNSVAYIECKADGTMVFNAKRFDFNTPD